MEPVIKPVEEQAERPDGSLFRPREARPVEPVEPPVRSRDFGTGPFETEEGDMDHGIEAEYMLETSAVCPHCLEDIQKVQVVRMLRAKVNFVSSLPRRGQILVCPKCRIALAGALGGLI